MSSYDKRYAKRKLAPAKRKLKPASRKSALAKRKINSYPGNIIMAAFLSRQCNEDQQVLQTLLKSQRN